MRLVSLVPWLVPCLASAGLSGALDPPPPFMRPQTARVLKTLEESLQVTRRDPSGIHLQGWRRYLAFLDEETRPGFGWMIGSRRTEYFNGFRAGAETAFLLREEGAGLDLRQVAQVQYALLQGKGFPGWRGYSRSHQMGFMAGLESMTQLEHQRPLHRPGSLEALPAEVALAEPLQEPAGADPSRLMEFGPSPSDTPEERDAKARQRAFLKAQRLHVRPHWGVALGGERDAYEDGFREGGRLWDRNSYGYMSPKLGQDLLRTSLQGKPSAFAWGFMGGIEAPTGFHRRRKGVAGRLVPPPPTGEDPPELQSNPGFLPESYPLSKDIKTGTLLVDAVGLENIAAFVAAFDGAEAERLLQRLARARCLGREKDVPLHLPPGTRACLRLYDGRALPLRIHGIYLFAGGWCFASD